jgi:hypothetical protein
MAASQPGADTRGTNSLLHRFNAWVRVIGRLKPGASPNALPSRLTNLLRGWLVNESGFPPEWMSGIKAQLPKQKISIVPAGTGVGVMRANYSASLNILLTVCCLVLLIACANIANLLLARGASRRAQTSVRLALGASSARLMRQSLTESLVLSVMGGLLGLAVAFLGVKAVVALVFHGAQYVPIDAAPSLPVLGFAFLLSLLTGASLARLRPGWRRMPIPPRRCAAPTAAPRTGRRSRRRLWWWCRRRCLWCCWRARDC